MFPLLGYLDLGSVFGFFHLFLCCQRVCRTSYMTWELLACLREGCLPYFAVTTVPITSGFDGDFHIAIMGKWINAKSNSRLREKAILNSTSAVAGAWGATSVGTQGTVSPRNDCAWPPISMTGAISIISSDSQVRRNRMAWGEE